MAADFVCIKSIKEPIQLVLDFSIHAFASAFKDEF